MDVQIEETGKFSRKLAVTIPVEKVNQEFDSAFKRVAKEARIPGFRPGKAPRQILEQRFGEEVAQEVRSNLVDGTLYQALQTKEVVPVAFPRLDVPSPKKGNAYSYTAEFDVQPEVTLTSYTGLKVPKVDVQVPEQMVQEQVDELRKQSAQLVPVLVRDTAQDGDVVLVDYEGTMGGVPFDGGKAENALIEIGASGFLPQFVDGLRGARVPGERVIQVDFPADYQAQHLAGKGATFKVSLKELKTKELPEFNDDFAKDMGQESATALREAISGSIKQRREEEAKSQERRAVLEALVAANPFDVPHSMIHAQAERMVTNAAERMQQWTGQKLNLGPQEFQRLVQSSGKDADFQVRSGLLLMEVAKSEKIEATQDDVDAEIERMAADAGPQAERLRAHYRNPEQRANLEYKVLEDKTMAFLRDKAQVDAALPVISGEPKERPQSDDAELDEHEHDHSHDHGQHGHVHGPNCNHG